MTSDALRTSRVVGLALIVGVFFTAEEVFMDLARRRPELIGGDVLSGAVFWGVWAPLTPLALAAIRRWPLDIKTLHRALLWNAIAAVALSATHSVISYGIAFLIDHPSEGVTRAVLAAVTGAAFVWGLFTGVVFYSIILMVHTAMHFRGLYAAEQIAATALKQELTQSKLDTLRSQLRPHFLFNTLNAVSVLVTEDVSTAQQVILRLSGLLRRSLDEHAHEVSLANELVFARDYLAIQQARFGERLRVSLAVDQEVLGASVPVFLLQPLLENAIEHGMSDIGPTTLVLRAAREKNGTLHIAVSDDGPGVPTNAPFVEGIGLGNTRARLRHLYGPHALVRLTTADAREAASGACVDLWIPYRDVES